MDAIEPLIDYAIGAQGKLLPQRIVELTKNLMFDTLSLMRVGGAAPGCAAISACYAKWGGRPEATVLTTGARLPAPVAAMINSVTTHALDFDDTHETADVHAFAVVLPAAMAIAEWTGRVAGRDFLTAIGIGAEVAYRMGEAIEKYRGWHPTATCGVFGATFGCGLIAGLDRPTLHNALGIAYSLSAGNWQAILDGSLTKRMQPAFAARAAVEATVLAMSGITGAKRLLEGTFGFYPLYEHGEYDRDALVKGLGERFEIERVSLKPYPCCRFCHSAPEATLLLAEEFDLRPQDVKRVTAKVPQEVKDLVGQPYRPGDSPEVSAQFSIPFCIAASLTHRRLGLQEFQRPIVLDPDIAELARKVDIVVVSNLDRWGPQEFIFTLNDGRVVSRTVKIMKGHPDHPLTRVEIMAKSRDSLVFAGLPPKISDDLARCLDAFEERPDTMASILGVMRQNGAPQ